MRFVLLVLMLLTSSSYVMQAQRIPPPTRTQVLRDLEAGRLQPTENPTQSLVGLTHWKTGAIIGAVAGVVFANAMMADEGVAVPRRVGLSLVSAAAAAMPGALFGGLFPKRE